MNSIIERYKKIRKKGLLEKKFKGKYAFVGVGNHSINNLYPVLNYLNVDLKYIVVKSSETLSLAQTYFKDAKATIDLNEVLTDDEIKGIFVSANPESHFGLAKKIIAGKKSLFIEKPPCLTLSELNELAAEQNKNNTVALTGLQRRYSPVFQILKNKVKNASYYSVKYKTGAYPEGNELLDLFIHPIDAAFYLFGTGKVEHIQLIKKNGTATYLFHIVHQSGIVGNFELPTAHSWTEAIDEFTICTPRGDFYTENTSKLTFSTKPTTVFNIPIEKVKTFLPQTTTLYLQNNFLPIKTHNQLYASGYFNEIESFLNACENGNIASNKSSFNQLVPTFEAIEILQKKIQS